MAKKKIPAWKLSPIKIEKGIPIPALRRKTQSKETAKTRSTLLYPFPIMKMGDSFFVPNEEDSSRMHRTAQRYKSRHPGWNYCARKVTEKRVVGIRLWKVPVRLGIA
jgi:hypothetical protein